MALMRDLIRAGVLGAIAGYTAGAPHRGKASFTRLSFYDPIPVRMAPSEGLDAWWIWLGHLRAKRGTAALGGSLFAQWSSVEPEAAFGLANMALGCGAPLSGVLRNPYSHGSQAFIRSLFWGLAFHGRPDEAARWALADASLDHSGDGAVLPACAAWMLAAAAPGVSVNQLAKVFTRCLPPDSLFLKALPHVLEAGAKDQGVHDLRLKLTRELGLADESHAALTMSFALAGLLANGGAFSPSVLAAAGCGGASDQAGAVAGAISAVLSGGVPPEYLAPLGKAYVGSHALRGIESPTEIAELCAWVEQLAPAPAPIAAPAPAEAPAAPIAPAEPAEATSEAEPGTSEEPAQEQLVQDVPAAAPEPEAPAAAPAAPMVPEPSPGLAEAFRNSAYASSSEANGMEVSWMHLESPVIGPRQSAKLTVTFRNETDEEKEVFPELIAPEGFRSASRLAAFRLPGKAVQSFPMVLQAPDAALTERVFARVKAGTAEYRTPLFPAQLWHLVGPFVNHDGSGYDKVFPAESAIRPGQAFNGRSDLPVKWEPRWLPGVVFDLEPEFKNGPGVVLVWARLRMPAAGRMTLFCAASVGVVAFVDGQRVLGYHDEHKPNLSRRERYSASFATEGEFSILLKVLRNKKPMEPLVLYFLGPDGQVVHPIQTLPMS